ncbi:hypothetical protein JW859_11150 [bacterium]|nr:hypothetical protein [bacterium]
MGVSGYAIENQDWYQEVISAIRARVYANDRQGAAAALKQAWQRVEELELTIAQRELMTYILKWYEFTIALQCQSRQAACQIYKQVHKLFIQPAQTPPGEAQRCRLLASLRCNGRLYGCSTFTRDELIALIKDLPNLNRDEFLWHNIAGWAFAERDEEILRQAYEVLLTRPTHLLGQAKWQRVNIMLLLLTGRATPRDVEYTINGMQVMPQIIEFRELIWPECVRQKLVNRHLVEKLKLVYQRIKLNPPVPELEPSGKHILG